MCLAEVPTSDCFSKIRLELIIISRHILEMKNKNYFALDHTTEGKIFSFPYKNNDLTNIYF